MGRGTGQLAAQAATIIAVVALTVGAAALTTSAAGVAAPSRAPVWQVQPTPSPTNDAELNGISCASVDRCVAVGTRDNGRKPLVESWNDDAWSVDPIADPLVETDVSGLSMGGVSCATPTSCMAVGSYEQRHGQTGVTRAFSELYDGSSWRLRATVGFAASTSYADLSAVSCARTTFCLAVGSTSKARDTSSALAERWDGSTWRRIEVPGAVAQQPTFAGVSCLSTEVCTAVGSTTGGPRGYFGLAERYADGSWTKEAAPPFPDGTESVLDAVSCPSTAGCVAVGSSLSGGDTVLAVAEVRSHGHWRVVKVPMDSPGSGLSGVSCTSLSDCRAVGSRVTMAGFVETWNGAAWHGQSTAASDGPPQLDGVSCTTGTHCSAAGSSGLGGEHTVVERN